MMAFAPAIKPQVPFKLACQICQELKISQEDSMRHLPEKVSGRVVTGHVFSLLDVEVSVWRTLLDDSELCCTLQYIYSQTVVGKIMATEKTTTLTFRIEPNIKEALCTAADRDHRSIANIVTGVIRSHCARAGTPMPDSQALSARGLSHPKSGK